MTCSTHPMTVTMTTLIGLTLGSAAPAALAQPGWVLSHQKISDTQGGFTGILDYHDYLGISAAALGDVDGDGVTDLAVGAYGDDDGGPKHGAVWVLFLDGVPACLADINSDGEVDGLDLLLVLAAWGNTSGPEDINGDGIVNVLDILEVLGQWGPCP